MPPPAAIAWVPSEGGGLQAHLNDPDLSLVAVARIYPETPEDPEDADGPEDWRSGGVSAERPHSAFYAQVEGDEGAEALQAILVRVVAAYAGWVDQDAAIRKAEAIVLRRTTTEWLALERVLSSDLPPPERDELVRRMVETFAEGNRRLLHAALPSATEDGRKQRLEAADDQARELVEAAELAQVGP